MNHVTLTVKIEKETFRKLETILHEEMFKRQKPRFRDIHELLNILLSRALTFELHRNGKYHLIRRLTRKEEEQT